VPLPSSYPLAADQEKSSNSPFARPRAIRFRKTHKPEPSYKPVFLLPKSKTVK
jgi:hypothetical protein